MPSISDVSSLAQSTYAPATIAALTLLIVSSFLDVRAAYSRIFERFFNTFVKASPSTVDELGDDKAQKQETILRISLLVFLALAWPPFFYSIGNLSPISLTYSQEPTYFATDTTSLARIACSRSVPLDPFAATRFVESTATYADEAQSKAVNGQIKRAFAMMSVAQSLLCLFVFCATAAVVVPSLRQIHYGLLVLSVMTILYVGISTYGSLREAVFNQAFVKVESVVSKIPDAELARITPKCLSKFKNQVQLVLIREVNLTVDWPRLTALLPSQE